MKRQIRHGVFETNSSSTHSITMCTKSEFDDWRNGKLYRNDGWWTSSTSKLKNKTFLTYDEAIELIKTSSYYVPIEEDDDVDEYLKEYEIYSYENWEGYHETDVTHYTTPNGEEIVATDDKQRYSFNEDKTLIRANQGHSIDVDVELEEVEPPEYLWHGTATKSIESIRTTGLVPKSRLYVHLSDSYTTAVLIGKRHGKPMVFCVKSGQMYTDGYKFYKSKNGVWLTKFVPKEYLG